MPPALLMWWRTELPADSNATIVEAGPSRSTSRPPAGHRAPGLGPLCPARWGRGRIRRAFRATLPIDHLVELDGIRYAINLRPIHPDELDAVACP